MDTDRLTNFLCFVIVYERRPLNLILKYWTSEEGIDTDRFTSLLCLRIFYKHRPLNLILKYGTSEKRD